VNAMSRICGVALVVAGACTYAAPSASAATITLSQSVGSLYATTGIAPTITNGNTMDGMRVTAVLSDGSRILTLSRVWSDSAAPDTGGVNFSTPEFALSVTGDTFEANNWLLDTSNIGAWHLLTLDFDGSTGQTVFDRTFGGSFGTPNSVSGRDFGGFLSFGGTINALYTNIVAIGPNAPVGDIFANVVLTFGDGTFANGLTGGRQYRFSLDTDTAASTLAPEPGTMVLLGTGLLALAGGLRRSLVHHAR
jgi:PEP-CTERM motif